MVLDMVQAITLLSESGGVGKTATTINLAAALNRRGKDVLVIDTDPQAGSLTSLVGFEELKETKEDDLTLKDALLSPENRMDEIIVEGAEFDLVPSGEDLGNFEMQANLESIPGRELRLRNELEAAAEEYDYDHYLIDTPGTLNLLVYNAIVATRNVLIPMEMTSKGELSTGGIERTVSEIETKLQQAQPNISLSLWGIVPNKVGQSNIYQEIQEDMENEGRTMLPVQIDSLDCVKYAERERYSIFEYAEYEGMRGYAERILTEYDKLAQIVSGEWNPVEQEEPPGEVPDIHTDGEMEVPEDHPSNDRLVA